MKSYLFTYSQVCPQEQAHDVLNGIQDVKTWIAPFPYSAILVSKLSAHALSDVLCARLPNVWFLVAEMDCQTANGWLPGNLWEYVNDPQKAWSGNLIREIFDPKYLRRPVADADRMAGT